MDLLPGIYEQIINQLFKNKVDAVDTQKFHIGKRAINKDDAVKIISRYLQHILELAFDSVEKNDVGKSIDFVNDIIHEISRKFNIDDCDTNIIAAGNSILTSVIDITKCDYPNIEDYLNTIRPLTPLSKSALFFGGGDGRQVSMEEELRREILCADEICWVVSFIKLRGLNLLIDNLKQFTAKGKPLKVITTTYTKATDYEAVRRLAALPNTEVKVLYDETKDRLHAKSYIFLRNSGFHTAYLGSSNLSEPALKDGREWNFKATQFELPDVVDAMRKSFDTYWCDDNFEQFVPGVDDDRLKKALDKNHVDDNLLDFSLFDLVRAKDYQLAILERLETEREVHGRYRNLIVAATGTGKTVISAYDFKRYYEKHPDCRFLFIAHRQEILRQSLQTYRYILEDQNFGELMYSGHKPNNYRHMFASKDMLINRLDETILTPDYYDYIVVDEVHHIVAATYVKLMNYFKPKILIGLTATPERMNASEDITVFFDGHISAEIRLPDALNAGILAPFEYYGIPDGTDLSEIKWTAGGYDPVELTKIYTTNDLRTKLILDKVQEYIGGDIHTAKALCFCVNKEHARYMNAKFTLAGLHSDVLTSDDSESHRKEVRSKLKHGNINYLFVVDIFNEGVDIPEIDLILFLRPTESLTVFLQQFGRGLRKSEGKTHLTVLDFVGHARAEFNYKERFEALIGRKTLGIKKEIEYGFPNAPFNCKITLEPKAREEILENITGFLGRMRSNRIVAEIKTFYESNKSTFSLKTFVEHSNIPLHRIYKSMTWGRACVEARVTTEVSGFDSAIAYAVKNKWLATDSYSYFSQLLKFAESGFKCDVSEFSELETRYATMLYYDMYEHEGAFASMQQMFNAFASDRLLINELCDVLSLLRDGCNALEKPDNSVYAAHNPLKLHGVYTKAQIQAALGFSTFEKCSTAIKDGVERRRDIKLEAMYVNIIKKENTSASTNYQDFALSRSKFHWETQNKVSDTCPTAQSYRMRENHMLLFVRQQHSDPELKITMAYTYLGEVDLERMEGSRPVKIVWNLRTPMSESTFAFASMYKAIG